MQGSKPISTPLTPYNKDNQEDEDFRDAGKYRSLVGGLLLYLATTQPDIYIIIRRSFLSIKVYAKLLN